MSHVSEHDATVAVEAAARKIYEDNSKALNIEDDLIVSWDELPPLNKRPFREAVLPIVWAALEAVPDPRRGAWFEGYSRGCHDEQTEQWTSDNPYPQEES